MSSRSRPRLSVIVVVYNMEREAPRSLHSLSAQYQQGVSAGDYEVIVVDNGSPRPFNNGSVSEFGPNFRYYYVKDANQSPARAINLGLEQAAGDYLAIMIDGARILTPGVLRYGLNLPKIYRNPCGLTHGFHLGYDFQPRAIRVGYDQQIEEALLVSIQWPSDGYRLFEVASVHGRNGSWFNVEDESNFTFLHRSLLESVGGFDERFRARGGGLLNLAVERKLFERSDVDVVVILGEGTFHQLHGGITSSRPFPEVMNLVETFIDEYKHIEGRDWQWPVENVRLNFTGHLPRPSLPLLRQFVDAVTPEVKEKDQDIHRLHLKVAQITGAIHQLNNDLASARSLLATERATSEERLAAVASAERSIQQREAELRESREQLSAVERDDEAMRRELLRSAREIERLESEKHLRQSRRNHMRPVQ